MRKMLHSLKGAMLSIKEVVQNELDKYEDMIERPEETFGPMIRKAQHMIIEKQGRADRKAERKEALNEKIKKAEEKLSPEGKAADKKQMEDWHKEQSRELKEKLSEQVLALKENQLGKLPADIKSKVETILEKHKDGRDDIR